MIGVVTAEHPECIDVWETYKIPPGGGGVVQGDYVLDFSRVHPSAVIYRPVISHRPKSTYHYHTIIPRVFAQP